MSNPILNAPSPNQHKLDILREHFPQAVEVDAQGRVRINAATLQQAIDPSNPAGVQVEEDGYELRWVGKREAYHSAKDQHLYLAGDVLLIVKTLPLDELTDTLRALQTEGTPALHLTVYAPWIAADNFMLRG